MPRMFTFTAFALMAAMGTCQSKEATMDIRISAFPREGMIPKAFTADGVDHSPALAWSGAPTGTVAFALIMDDPDAPMGLWTHWTLWDLPASMTGLDENVPKAPTLSNGAHQGKNTWGRLGYNGPSPPPGHPHRYYFKVFALSQSLDLAAGATREELDRAMKGKVLAEGSYMAKYGR